MLKQIIRIKNFRIFRDYSKSSNLKDFKKFNVIYGWNGCGKTTLSTFFRLLDGKITVPDCGEYTIITDNGEFTEKTIASSNLMIRVFNQDFIKENVFTSSNEVSPIFFLGTEDIAKQQKIEKLKTDRIPLKDKESSFVSELEIKGRSLDKLCKSEAKRIKDFLRSNRENEYSYYDSPGYRAKCNSLKMEDFRNKILKPDDLLLLKKSIDTSLLDPIPILSLPLLKLDDLKLHVEKILADTVLSVLIPRLENDPELNSWVERGLGIVKTRAMNNCPFCTHPLSPEYVNELEGHFNDRYIKFIGEINAVIQEILDYNHAFKIVLPSKNDFYQEFSNDYEKNKINLEHDLEKLSAYLIELSKELEEKKKNPFKKFLLCSEEPEHDVIKNLTKINEIIELHNLKCQNFMEILKTNSHIIEESFVAEKLEEYLVLNNEIIEIKQSIDDIQNLLKENQSEIEILEKEIILHRPAADKINEDLFRYLGRDEIKLETKENGYQITRYGVLATELSEGEKTAISFIYFLNKLQEKEFKIEEGIVVIDDPISSLDANSLHNAFEFMRNRTGLASQLFVLTHNFSFLREVNNWFNHENHGKNASSYILKNKYSLGYRIAFLDNLDSFLKDYHSEYQYLFSLVYENAKSAPEPLENYYLFPNISRRLLESFLAFRVPSQTKMWKQMNKISFDEVKKVRIYRFVNDNSHANHIRTDPHRDLSFLGETQAISVDLLDLIKNVDPRHYHEMESLVSKKP